jgi:hypothetical protein
MHGVTSLRANPVPVTLIDAPAGPEAVPSGPFSTITMGIMFNVAVADTGVPSVTVTGKLRPVNATRRTNWPCIVKSGLTLQKLVAAHAGLNMPHGPAKPKLVPVTSTVSPTRAGLGVSVWTICGTTLNPPANVAPSPVLAATDIVFTPAGLFAVLTTNEPVTTPPLTWQVQLSIALAVPLTEQVESPLLKPVPVIWIVSPPLPVSGTKAILGEVNVNVAETAP